MSLGILAAELHIIAYVTYNVQATKGTSAPNATSWLIWAILASMNACTYSSVTGDVYSALQFIAGSAATVVTFLYVLSIGKFSRPKDIEDFICLSLAIIAGGVWWFYRSADYASMIILIAFVVSFRPTLRGVIQDPTKESPPAWIVWTLACLVTLVNVLLQGKGVYAIISPVVFTFLHAWVGWLSRSKRIQKHFALAFENTEHH